jgi:uncharacterized protein (TIGR02466 family)
MMTNKKISMWFPTLIYENILDTFRSHTHHLLSKAYSIRAAEPDVKTEWSCDTYNTMLQYNAIKDDDKIVQLLITECKNLVIDFAKEFGINKTIADLECNDFWFNIAEPGSYQEYHQHPRSDFSLVYYVKTNKDSGNIVFQPSSSISDSFPLITDELTYASFRTCSYNTKESLVLIFRSSLAHMVEKNLSNEDRISIAMNFKFKEPQQ